MKELIGKTIESLAVSPRGDYLLFRTTTRDVGYVTSGDCCSETWFADILGVEALLGERVTQVEEVNLPDYNADDGRCRQDVDSVYCYKITTGKGRTDVIFRNSSNGYYGGEIELTKEKEPEGMIEITKDWSSD